MNILFFQFLRHSSPYRCVYFSPTMFIFSNLNYFSLSLTRSSSSTFIFLPTYFLLSSFFLYSSVLFHSISSPFFAEILRSMLYRGSDTIRDIEWVIFDEVHCKYGYENTILRMIYKSLTVPSSLHFLSFLFLSFPYLA